MPRRPRQAKGPESVSPRFVKNTFPKHFADGDESFASVGVRRARPDARSHPQKRWNWTDATTAEQAVVRRSSPRGRERPKHGKPLKPASRALKKEVRHLAAREGRNLLRPEFHTEAQSHKGFETLKTIESRLRRTLKKRNPVPRGRRKTRTGGRGQKKKISAKNQGVLVNSGESVKGTGPVNFTGTAGSPPRLSSSRAGDWNPVPARCRIPPAWRRDRPPRRICAP